MQLVSNRLITTSKKVSPQSAKEDPALKPDTGKERNEKIEDHSPEEYNLIYQLKQLKNIEFDGEKA